MCGFFEFFFEIATAYCLSLGITNSRFFIFFKPPIVKPLKLYLLHATYRFTIVSVENPLYSCFLFFNLNNLFIPCVKEILQSGSARCNRPYRYQISQAHPGSILGMFSNDLSLRDSILLHVKDVSFERYQKMS